MLVVWNIAETYSEPSQTSKVEFFVIIVNDGKLLSIFAKKSILNVCLRFWILLSIVSQCVGSVRIRRFSGPFFSRIRTEYEENSNAGKYGPEKLRIWTLFIQCHDGEKVPNILMSLINISFNLTVVFVCYYISHKVLTRNTYRLNTASRVV